jgi:hypothetical protein
MAYKMKYASPMVKHCFKMTDESPMKRKLTASCKAAARRKFKVYPSAYANMWASKQQGKGKC